MTDSEKKELAKKRLLEIEELDNLIDAKSEILEKLKQLSKKAVRVVNEVARGNDVKTYDQNSNAIAAKVDFPQEINADIDKLVDLRHEIYREIKLVEDEKYRAVLIRKYLLLDSWDMTAARLGYTKRHVYRLHDESLDAFAEILLKKEKMSVNVTKCH